MPRGDTTSADQKGTHVGQPWTTPGGAFTMLSLGGQVPRREGTETRVQKESGTMKRTCRKKKELDPQQGVE